MDTDWLWVLDADSVPRADALELLTRLAEDGGPEHAGTLASSAPPITLVRLGQMLRGRLLTPAGHACRGCRDAGSYVDCDSVIWSGALINLAVVDRVGLPRAGTLGCWEDLSLDYGDTEYTYRIHRAGIQNSSCTATASSIIRSAEVCIVAFSGWDLYSTNHPAFRRYLYFRNLVFFWLRIYHRRNWPMLLVWFRLSAQH